MERQQSKSDTLDDIIDRYISPAPSLSPVMHRHEAYDRSSKYNKENGTVGSLPSSPPSFTLEKIHQRDTPTNSGYFSRAELFGRSSPIPTDSLPSSRGLERVAERQRTGHGMPDADSMSSPSLQSSFLAQNVLAGRPFLQNVYDERAGPFSTPNLRASRGCRLPASHSTRSGFSGMPQNEWEEAGTPVKRDSGGHYGSGPTLEFANSFRFPHTATSMTGASDLSEAKFDGGVRNVFPAEEALRSTLSNMIPRPKPRPPKSRGTSWTSKRFNRQQSSNESRSIAKSRFSDDNISELEYVEPSLPRESLQAILARARHREEKPPTSSETLGLEQPKYGLRDTFYQPHVQNDDALISTVSDIVSTQSNEVRYKVPCDTASGSSAQSTNTESHDGLMASNLPTSQLSYSKIKVIWNDAPLSAQPGVVLPTPVIEHVQGTRPAPQHCLSMASIKEFIALKLIAVQAPHGLKFASANAIVYGCVTVAAMRFAHMNIGESVRAYDLAAHMTVAGFVGLILCMVLHLGRSG